MSDQKEKFPSIEVNDEETNIGSSISPDVGSNGSSFSHSTQVAGGLQARVLAFQQKRSKSQSTSTPPQGLSPAIHRTRSPSESNVDIHNKPLPELPLSPQRSLQGNDKVFSGSSSPVSKDKNLGSLAMDPQMLARLSIQNAASESSDSKFKESGKDSHTDLKKMPSLSQRRGMKFNLQNMTDNQVDEPAKPILHQPAMYDINTTGELTRRLSERKKKPNFRLNLGDSPTKEDSDNKNAKQLVTDTEKKPQLQGLFARYSKYVDIKSGSLNFAGKASLHSKGVDFSSGSSFRISLDELELLDELGHGNYGVVSKVLHKPTGVLMAMKEVRLELDETKFTQILMELEILHKCDSPYVVDFYGAFFVEGAVYMCIEYMDGGSLDKIYGKSGIKDEACLSYITECVIRGLKELKDVHNIIHRDVKPTNILVNTSGKVKLCDFGVSGNLVASLAKTNIGCQSYMAPERIKSLNPSDTTYSVQSDIWSLGLTILEVAAGHYPYPPETYGNIFSQLSAIVDGQPPQLDKKIFSKEAQHFVKSCLNKNPDLRPSYAMLLTHPWLKKYRNVDSHMDKLVQEKVSEIKEKTTESTLGSTNSLSEPRPDNVQSLLKERVRYPPLHRGGLKLARGHKN